MKVQTARGYQLSRDAPNLTERTTESLRQAILQLRLGQASGWWNATWSNSTAQPHLHPRRVAVTASRGAGGAQRWRRVVGRRGVAGRGAADLRSPCRAGGGDGASVRGACRRRGAGAALGGGGAVEAAVRRGRRALMSSAFRAFYDVLLDGSGNDVAHRFLSMLDTRITYLRRLTTRSRDTSAKVRPRH